jgi:hypothetical protein
VRGNLISCLKRDNPSRKRKRRSPDLGVLSMVNGGKQVSNKFPRESGHSVGSLANTLVGRPPRSYETPQRPPCGEHHPTRGNETGAGGLTIVPPIVAPYPHVGDQNQ